MNRLWLLEALERLTMRPLGSDYCFECVRLGTETGGVKVSENVRSNPTLTRMCDNLTVKLGYTPDGHSVVLTVVTLDVAVVSVL